MEPIPEDVRMEEEMPMAGGQAELPESGGASSLWEPPGSEVRRRIVGKRSGGPQDGQGDDDHGKRARLLQLLAMEVEATTTGDAPWIGLEDPPMWCPLHMIKEGDMRELQGLLERPSFVEMAWSEVGPDTRVITTQMVRRMKNEAVKSRLVLQDYAVTRVLGAALFAATLPSYVATSIVSCWVLGHIRSRRTCRVCLGCYSSLSSC